MKKRPIRVEGEIAYVPLPRGLEAIIDAEDAEKVNRHNWFDNGSGYAQTKVRSGNGKRRNISLHRLIMNPPNDMQIDHIHGETLDNRKSQLRLATSSQNSHNKGVQANNKSGFKGVTWEKARRKWRAKIKLHNKRIDLGYFDTAEAAHAAYCEAAHRLHGEFARTA
jgi:hypothetical protein